MPESCALALAPPAPLGTPRLPCAASASAPALAIARMSPREDSSEPRRVTAPPLLHPLADRRCSGQASRPLDTTRLSDGHAEQSPVARLSAGPCTRYAPRVHVAPGRA